MEIQTPRRTRKDGYTYQTTTIDGGPLEGSLWFSLPSVHEDLLSESSDGALLALLIPAMYCGEDIQISSKINAHLVTAINQKLQTLLIEIMPFLTRIDIEIADKNLNTTQIGTGVAKGVGTGFSGGIDSWLTILERQQSSEHPPLTHLLFNNVGSHGSRDYSLFIKRFDELKSAAEELDLPFLSINSNMNSFYKPLFGKQLGFQQTHTIRNAAVAFSLGAGLGEWLYSSTYTYKDIACKSSKDMARADPIILSILSRPELQLHDSGTQLSRFQKTVYVADNPLVQNHLDICVKGAIGENCSECWKCLRTLTALDITGKVNNFNQSFDLEKYRKVKRKYLRKIIFSIQPMESELRIEAKKNGYPMPLIPSLFGSIVRFMKTYFRS